MNPTLLEINHDWHLLNVLLFLGGCIDKCSFLFKLVPNHYVSLSGSQLVGRGPKMGRRSDLFSNSRGKDANANLNAT